MTAIRRLLSREHQPPTEPVIKAGIVPRLIEFITAPDAKLAFEAAWAVTNIASTDQTPVVVSLGAVPRLVQGMMSADANVRDQCVWCLGNIAGDRSDFRDALLATPGAVQALMLNLQHPENPVLLRNATWTLSNLCRGKPAPPAAMLSSLVPALVYLVGQADKDVVADAAWGLSYITEGTE